MAKKKVNVALVGAQFMGKAHSNAWRKVGMFFDAPVEPVMKVLCGKFKEEVAVAEKWGWQETSLDWKEVVNRPDIDIVDICTPNFLHPAIAIEAAKAGKHIVCEKPLANTLKEAQDMLKAADKAGVKHMCGFSYRFAPAVQTIKNMIVKKELGDIYHFRAAYQQDWIADPDFPMVWRLKKKHTGSGALGDIGAHITDLCHFLVGDVSELAATMETFIKKRVIADSDVGAWGAKGRKKQKKYDTVDVDDAVAYVARIKGANTLATFEATRFAPGRRNYNSIEIYGSKGSVLWNKEDMNVFQYYNCADPATAQGFRKVLATDSGHPYTHAWWPPGHLIGYEHLFVHEIFEFLCGLNRKKNDFPTFADAVKCQKVLDAVERAAKTKRWVAVK
ncbi:MAG TPA: Gfo/Idh/MocA family oxidoreductase [Candidatus Hydrogenedentes bacterium]|jgi:predicted dehydrogenase|nr:Gfo/Idh/MocA family oxidoreductase [Candidatus Hydrogenedentota bacterium]MDY0032273.1 Gfo/Idh/MocA family oxidoreductase [FCB group bacterium]NLT62109.1 Gfo/Idh/MocA family oxidoreductase [Candidatus Hydrogenedentota bacterium]HNZ17191.1 Gfo/Idh/MocA family oxidoreductase [Candidatus Hydrogenedentota bacterium]HOH32869.1 Gfo/Idh/MocA family oxidoreductase [Candidatus Hydrogenedentota bacterium]